MHSNLEIENWNEDCLEELKCYLDDTPCIKSQRESCVEFLIGQAAAGLIAIRK